MRFFCIIKDPKVNEENLVNQARMGKMAKTDMMAIPGLMAKMVTRVIAGQMAIQVLMAKTVFQVPTDMKDFPDLLGPQVQKVPMAILE